MFWYLRNLRSKQTSVADLQFFFFELYTLFQKLEQKIVKKRTLNMKVYYIILLSYQFTEDLENTKSNNVIFFDIA